ncbi:universal stress protein, partial [Olleya sp. AH-315-F22]|nr:universal stress protein [Olleya sp. AH-315-F22]
EVPNQTFLDAFTEDSPRIKSLDRRISGLAKAKNINIDFEAAVTHDISNTMQDLSDQINCDWLVMGWNGKAHNGLLVRNPIGWLVTYINSNFALFKDNGVRHISRVLLALRPGRKDKNFIATTDRLCQFYNARLTLLHVVSEDTDESTIKQMKEKSKQLLKKATSFNEVKVIKSNNPIDTISKTSADFDLLILGTPQKDNWISVLFGTGKDKFTEKSACSVLRLTVKND